MTERLLEIAASEPDSLALGLAPKLDLPEAAVDVATTRILARELAQVAVTYRLPPESDRPLWSDGGGRLYHEGLLKWTQDELAAQVLFEE